MPTRHAPNTRSHAVVRLKYQLEDRSFPRIQMGLIVCLTGAFGLLSSFMLLRGGIDSMALRYPLALCSAYLFFLFLLWLWLRTKASDYNDVPDLGDAVPKPGSSASQPAHSSGGGGNFGGSGATDSFDQAPCGAVSSRSHAAELGEVVSSVTETEELAIPIIAIALALGLALASIYVIYLAPTLFAELLFDGALSYSLYRHLRGLDSRHWIRTALRHTVVPFAVTAVFL